MYSRTELLIGEENVEKLKNSKVLVIGLGGVGAYALEALVRVGIGTLGLCDFDKIDVSNKNRQLLALDSTIGKAKVSVAAQRARDINPDCKLFEYNFKVNDNTITDLNLDFWDYVVDCIDDVKAKLIIAKACNFKLISCMGTGNKLNSDEFRITDINKTEQDRLAKSIRKKSRDENLSYDVLFSTESPVQDFIDVIPSISYMPAIAGLKISEYIIKKIIDF